MTVGTRRTHTTSDQDGRLVVVLLRHEDVFDICVRLLRGEVIDVEDEAGRTWRATMDSFSLVFRGEANALRENAHAYDVALLLCARMERDPSMRAGLSRGGRRRHE